MSHRNVTPNLHRKSARLPFAATCLAALIMVAGLAGGAHAQGAGPLDTSTLPRPPAVKQLVALPQTTIIISADPVPAAAKAATALLEAQGWQAYVSAHGQSMPQPNTELITLKKGGHGLTLHVQMAPAQGNATTISYTAMPLERDLPFPAQASAIQVLAGPLSSRCRREAEPRSTARVLSGRIAEGRLGAPFRQRGRGTDGPAAGQRPRTGILYA